MKHVVVLDASAFDIVARDPGTLGRPQSDVVVRCAAVTLAEVCRTPARTREVEALLRRRPGGHAIEIVPTEEQLAKRVGRLLVDAERGSCHLADAHVVAICADADRALVITSDPDDISHLAASLPGVRIMTRRP